MHFSTATSHPVSRARSADRRQVLPRWLDRNWGGARKSAAGLLVALTAWCNLLQSAPAYTPSHLRIGFAPWDNPNEISQVAQEVTKLLTAELHMPVEPKVATDYAGVVEAMAAGRVDMAFFPPAAYVRAEQLAHAKVILKSMFHGKSAYYSAIITRKDSGIKTLKDLRNHSFAFVDPTSTSGNIYPRVLLLDAGIKPERDMRQVLEAGGHDAVVLAVFNRKVDAGACFANDAKGQEAAWTKPGMRKMGVDPGAIRVLAISQPIPADNMAVRSDLDPLLVNRIKTLFLRMSQTPAGRARIKSIYRVDGFAVASPRDYEPVRQAFKKVGFNLR